MLKLDGKIFLESITVQRYKRQNTYCSNKAIVSNYTARVAATVKQEIIIIF